MIELTWALLLGESLAGEPLHLVGVVADEAVRLELTRSGRRLSGEWTAGGSPALSARGRARGQVVLVKFGDARLEGTLRDGTLEGSLSNKSDAGISVTLGDGVSAPVLISRDETWRREWDGKPSQEIPVSLPQLLLADMDAQARIDAALSPESLLDASREDIEADGWVDSVSWSVPWQAEGLISLDVRVMGSGAYPSASTRRLVIDLARGEPLGAEIFAPEGRDALTARLDAALRDEIALAVADDPEIAGLLADVSFSEANLSQFSADEAGLVFTVELGLPHAVAAAMAPPVLRVSWEELGPFLTADCPLRRLIPG
ncbi:hypothetical protein L6R46_28085 [Myxococcota bacterium]|nr:hypothetical protein [Myxococcota bacterium]